MSREGGPYAAARPNSDLRAFDHQARRRQPGELINEKGLDRRKLSALKFWGLIEDAGAKLRLSERGRWWRAAKELTKPRP
jgi:hypothetical protein